MQNKIPENRRSLANANPSVANTLSAVGTASKSCTANCTLKISTSIPRKQLHARSCKSGNSYHLMVFRIFTMRPARYTPMVTVINFSNSPSPPNCPSMISLNTNSRLPLPALLRSIKQHAQHQRDEQKIFHGKLHNPHLKTRDSVL